MKTQFEQMMDGLNDVEAFLAGEQEGFKAHVPQRASAHPVPCQTQHEPPAIMIVANH
jgi:hypothetical protein